MTKRMLFVDDERSLECELPGYDIDYARNANVAVNLWIQNDYDEIWLDHDLGDSGGDIMQLVNSMSMYGFLFNDERKLPEVIVHSMNPVGAENIMGKLAPYYVVKRIPYSTIISNNDGIGYV